LRARLRSVLRENEVLRRENEVLRAAQHSELPPLWALEDWTALRTKEDLRELGKRRPASDAASVKKKGRPIDGRQRLGVAATLYAKAHPKWRRSAEGGNSLDALAAAMHDLLPALRQSAAAKATNAAKRRVLLDATETGYVVPGRLVAGVVVRVAKRPPNVLVAVKSPAGDYRAVLRARDVTGVDESPNFAFLNATFPEGAAIVAEIRDVEITRAAATVSLSTRRLEREIGEMSTNPAAVYARAAAALAAQPKPESPAKRRKREAAAKATHASYLEHLEREGARAYEPARHTIDVLHAAGVET